MKELTIEQKAKAYDEAIKIAMSKIKNNKDHILYEEDIIDIFPELKESEDERIRKFISNELVCLRATYGKSSDRYEELTNAVAWLEKQGEQKSADKVNPKFHEGEWITNGEYTWKVISVSHLDYTLQNQCGHRVEDTIDYVNKEFHLWTIQDIKDGDVLQLGKVTAIFKNFINDEYCRCHCSIYGGEFEIPSQTGGNNSYWYHNAIPTNKEQRDLLFKKMKDAGYKWDSKKKELKKIEDESENYKQQVMDETTDSVKDCISQEFAEWSEEDENILEAYSRYR
jgi:hypothetical protein